MVIIFSLLFNWNHNLFSSKNNKYIQLLPNKFRKRKNAFWQRKRNGVALFTLKYCGCPKAIQTNVNTACTCIISRYHKQYIPNEVMCDCIFQRSEVSM